MILLHLSTAYAFLTVLAQEDPVTQPVRGLLREHGRFPTRRTWERRLAALPQHLPGLIGCFGRHLVALLTPWASHGRAVAVDSTPWKTSGGVWHKKHKEQGEMPHTSIDTEAGWSKSGWHSWGYGWKLHLAVSRGGGSVWLPLAADLTPANTADNTVAPQLLAPCPLKCVMSWGTRTIMLRIPDRILSIDPEGRTLCEQADRGLVATRRGPPLHHDAGVEVRRIFHKLRSQAIEPFNGLCKNVFEWRTQMPVKGWQRSQLLALGAVALYQLVLLYQHEQHLPLGKGIKPLLRAA